jgi:hypothetical protein
MLFQANKIYINDHEKKKGTKITPTLTIKHKQSKKNTIYSNSKYINEFLKNNKITANKNLPIKNYPSL